MKKPEPTTRRSRASSNPNPATPRAGPTSSPKPREPTSRHPCCLPSPLSPAGAVAPIPGSVAIVRTTWRSTTIPTLSSEWAEGRWSMSPASSRSSSRCRAARDSPTAARGESAGPDSASGGWRAIIKNDGLRHPTLRPLQPAVPDRAQRTRLRRVREKGRALVREYDHRRLLHSSGIPALRRPS